MVRRAGETSWKSGYITRAPTILCVLVDSAARTEWPEKANAPSNRAAAAPLKRTPAYLRLIRVPPTFTLAAQQGPLWRRVESGGRTPSSSSQGQRAGGGPAAKTTRFLRSLELFSRNPEVIGRLSAWYDIETPG